LRSKKASAKAARHTLDDGTPAHSFSTLLAELATIVRNTCRTPRAAPNTPTFEVLTTPNAKQKSELQPQANCLSRKDKLARREEELRARRYRRVPTAALRCQLPSIC
jgi:ABC-type cobalamin transport system ATPase subunit